jgi:glyoxylase-like metal-dependent hydrolase (beta-lactamase superfamily II)
MTIPAGMAKHVSPHVWMIAAVPNIAIVTGDRATLVVDTGLGKRNGAIVAREAQKLSKPGARLYLTTTHFHPEHAAGDQGFPGDTIIIRNSAQQKELDAQGEQFVDTFRKWGQAALLEGQKFRPTDIVYDREARLDLDGAAARLLWYGAAHTVGDQLIFVEPDDVLISGDVVQNKMLPGIATDASTVKAWRHTVEQIQQLPVKIVVPDHSPPGDASLVTRELAFLTDLETLTAQAKRDGKSADEAAKAVTAEMKQMYPDWTGMSGINPLSDMVKRAYNEN